MERRRCIVLSLHFLCRQLEAFWTGEMSLRGRDACPQKVELLEAQEVLRADCLYLGDPRSLPLLEEIQAERGALVLLAEMEGRACPVPPMGCAVLTFSCSLFRLYNTVAADNAQTERWGQELHKITEKAGYVHKLLRAAGELAGGPAVLLDPKGQLIAAAGLGNGSYLEKQLSASGALSPEALRQLFPAHMTPDCRVRVEVPGTGQTVYGRRVVQDGEMLWMLLMEEGPGAQGPDLRNLCDCTADHLCTHLLPSELSQRGHTTRAFRKCWEDIMERSLINRAEIQIALGEMPFPVHRFYRVIVISFRGKCAGVPYDYILSRLQDVFPDANMTIYQKDIILLYGYEERSFRFVLDDGARQQLLPLLRRYDGIMCVGNGTHHVESLGSMYLLGKRTIDLAYLLRESREEHVFFTEDYLIYTIIDLCVQRYLEEELNEDILYLTHPAVPALTRYDREHRTDLRDVLFYYLLNDCNLTATASALYMHRNTVNNKVNQIKKLTRLELDEPRLRQRLLLSCQIMRYYEIVMQREMQ